MTRSTKVPERRVPNAPSEERLNLELEVLRQWASRNAADRGSSSNQETHHVACILQRFIEQGRIVTTA